jgi:hypothetical protein
MRKFTIIDPLYMSFYSRDIYRDVAANWPTWLCFLYLLSLLALCWVPGMIRLDTDLTYYLNNSAPKYIAQMPDIVISKGEASIKEKQPYIIKDPETGETFMIIETTGSSMSLDNSKAVVLLTKDRLIVKTPDDKQQVLGLRELGDGTITKSVVKEVIEQVTELFALLLYPFAVIFSFIFRAAEVLIIALFGSILSRSLGAYLSYKKLVKIGAIAITPLVIFNTMAVFFRIEIPVPFLTDIIFITAYQVFAIRSNAAPVEPQ